jgi:hypothetical protein
VYFLGVKGRRCVRLTTLPPSCPVVMKSGNLNFLEPSGPLQACNGNALHLPLPLPPLPTSCDVSSNHIRALMNSLIDNTNKYTNIKMYGFFRSCTLHLDTLNFLFLCNRCTIKYSKKNFKIYIKINVESAATCFGLNSHHQRANVN